MPVSLVLNCANVEEIKSAIFDRETDAVFRKSFDEIIGWIEKQANIEKIGANFSKWNDLIELIERRNLFVHANGRVNRQYLSKAGPNGAAAKQGEALGISSEYFRSSVSSIIFFGVCLVQVVWRKLAKNQVEDADDELNRVGYEMIIRGEYDLAELILRFGIGLRDLSSERARKRMIVNLANVLKLKGNEAESTELLSKHDWSIASSDFEICIAAIKGEVSTVVKLMSKIGAKGEISAHDYKEWPIFYHVRESSEFKECFKGLFGYEFVGSTKKRGGAVELIRLIGASKEQASNTEPKN